MKKFIIITTINQKTEAVKKFERFKDWQIILIGDKKSKDIKSENNITFLSIKDQEKLNFETIKRCPYNHYTRKNIGYLYAVKMGAETIYDTDDDNIPYDDWSFPNLEINKCLTSDNKFFNIYNYFTNEKIWPRGFPLDEINKESRIKFKNSSKFKIGAWQGLADIDPDVDAIFRLTRGEKIIFEKKEPIALDKGIYCPFNSQNTFWNKEAFMYLYLPSTVSFRFTDILRGYVAQRLFWTKNLNLGFTKATVFQHRNEHNLMKDFESEIEVFLNTKNIIDILDSINLNGTMPENIIKIYEKLAENKYVDKNELLMLKSWVNDFNKITN